MHKVRTRKGFTLMEMVIVLAIIAILFAVIFLSTGDYLDKAHQADASARAANDTLSVAFASKINKE